MVLFLVKHCVCDIYLTDYVLILVWCYGFDLKLSDVRSLFNIDIF